MDFDPRPRMRAAAAALSAGAASPVDVSFSELQVAPDCEIVMRPASPTAATIGWMLHGGNCIVSAGRCEWQSEEWIDDVEDESEFVRRGLEWSEALIARISTHGAAFTRLRGRAPHFLRETRAVVGDELPSRPFDRLESWEPW